MYIDTHTHINLITDNYEEQKKIIKSSFDNGIEKIFNIGVDIKTIYESKKLSEDFENIFFTAGFHPSVLNEKNNKIDLSILEILKNHKKLIGIGEIGLDYYYGKENKKEQQKLFLEQIEFAINNNLPIIIHTRDAWDDTFAILNEFKTKVKGIFHCFSGDYSVAKKCLEYNFYISFAGNITYKKATDLQDAAKKIPLSKIFIETDAPYLTPVPKRGKKNKPLYIKYTYEYIANLKNININELQFSIKKEIKNFIYQEEK